MAAVVLAIVVAAGAVIALRDKPSPVERQLDVVSDFVAGAPTASAHLEVTTTQVSDGHETVNTSTYDVDFARPGRSRWYVRDGSEAVETIFLPAGNFQRGSWDEGKTLKDRQFIFTDAEDDGGVAASATNFLTVVPPTSADVQRALGWLLTERLPQLLDRLEETTAAAAGHITGRISLGDAFAGAADIDDHELAAAPLTVDVFSGTDGRLNRLVLGWDHRSELGRHIHTAVDASFGAWDEPLTIAAPEADLVDLTPQIDEPGIAHASQKAGVKLVAPSKLPQSLELASAKVDERPDGCFTVALNYVDTAAADYSYLDLRLAPPACGPRATVVGTTMAKATVDKIMRSLKPLDWSTQPIVPRKAPRV